MTKQSQSPRDSKVSENRDVRLLPPGVEICLNNRLVSRRDVPEWQPKPGEKYESD